MGRGNSPHLESSIMNIEKIKKSKTDLEAQREQILAQLHMVEGAIQFCAQLIEEESEVKVEELPQTD